MKDLLNYYYYIIVDRINMVNHNYYFTYLNNHFCLYRFDNSLEELNLLFSLNTYMLYNNYKINKIILNKDMSPRTFYQNHYYVLVFLDIYAKEKIEIKDILEFNQRLTSLNILNRSNWYSLWTYKIDNIEYTMKHIWHKYKILNSSIYYYLGLAENAITYLNLFGTNNRLISISHQRVDSNFLKIDFYNPLNLIIDYRIRDMAEYFKSCFFKNTLSSLEIINYLRKIKMSFNDYLYFYIRMLFPSYYFDCFDLIVNQEIKETEILKIIAKQNEYEYLLYEIYNLFKNYINIPGIEWINKKYFN